MLTKLELLLELTKKAAEHGFDEEMELLNELLALRAEVIDELASQSDVSEAQKLLLRDIASYDEVIRGHMELTKATIANALEKMMQSRVQKNSYEQAYAAGSYFIDQKK